MKKFLRLAGAALFVAACGSAGWGEASGGLRARIKVIPVEGGKYGIECFLLNDSTSTLYIPFRTFGSDLHIRLLDLQGKVLTDAAPDGYVSYGEGPPSPRLPEDQLVLRPRETVSRRLPIERHLFEWSQGTRNLPKGRYRLSARLIISPDYPPSADPRPWSGALTSKEIDFIFEPPVR